MRPDLAGLDSTKSWYQLMQVIQNAGDEVIRTGEHAALDEQDAMLAGNPHLSCGFFQESGCAMHP